jgi:hypothetical protein
MKFKIRKVSKNIEADYPSQIVEAKNLISAAAVYCKANKLETPVDSRHSADDVYTLLSSSKTANVIGDFQIYEI